MKIVKDFFKDEETYHKIFDTYYGKVLDDFSFRNELIKVQFQNKKKVEMKVSKFIINMIFWKPYLRFNKEITENSVFEVEGINSDMIADYCNQIIDDFLTDKNQLEVNHILADIIEELSFISLDFNSRIGNSISCYDIIKVANENERFRDIIHTKYDENHIKTTDIEKSMNDRTGEILDILANTDNCFHDYVNCGEGINRNQLTQFMVNIGPKPDLKGNVYPKIVNTNILDGLKKPSDYYINCSGGRKVAITNSSKVKSSGYLMRKLSMLCLNTDVNLDVKDCKSQNYIKIWMNNIKTWKKFDKRYYLDKNNKLKLLDITKDKYENFEGKEIMFRSPITCALDNGKICKTCYGTLWKLSNKDFQISEGILAILILTSQITQMQLSTKHLLKTTTKKLKWDPIIQECFHLNGNTLLLNASLDNLQRYTIVINEDDIINNEEGLDDDDTDDDEDIDSAKVERVTKYFTKCEIWKEEEKVVGRKYPEDYEFIKKFKITLPTDVYLDTEFENTLNEYSEKDNGIYHLSFKYLQKDQPLFYIEVENNELSAIIDNISNLIDKKERLGTKDYNEMINKFIELCNDSNIKINSTHLEIVIKNLLRDSKNILEKPNFKEKDPDYIIMRLGEANINNPSVVMSLSYEQIKRQLYNPITYEKDSESLLDDFFM